MSLSPMRVLVACAAAGRVACGRDEVERHPNVLIVTLDTTRADRIGCYGGVDGVSPTIDALAADGVRFTRAIATAGLTPMSHASILTGPNNYAHGMRVFHSKTVSHRLKDEVDTLPEILAAKGYATVARVSSYQASEQYGLDQGFGDFESGVDLIPAADDGATTTVRLSVEVRSDNQAQGLTTEFWIIVEARS